MRCHPENAIAVNLVAMEINGGAFICGENTSTPFTGQLHMTFRNTDKTITGGTLKVVNGGRLILHGKQRVAWTRLVRTADIGTNIVLVPSTVDWKVGDEIVLAPSDFDFTAYETFRINAISTIETRKRIVLNGTTKYIHYGKQQTLKKNFILQSQAEVGLLTRNIKIYGDETVWQTQKIGVDVKIVGNAFGQIHSVEIRNGGIYDVLGRYPVHFHVVLNGSGQYVSSSSIYKSWNRCISVHCTDSMVVEDNVCVDHVGHGYFLEDGSERFNVIRQNLGVTTRAGSGNLNPSDKVPQGAEWAGPATFWLISPTNIFEGNVAAGSEWFGFSYEGTVSAINAAQSSSVCKERHRNVWTYLQAPFTPARNLYAHSTRSSGFWVEGYVPRSVGIFENIQTYKTGESGIHIATNNIELRNFTISDTRMGVWSTWTATWRDGVVVGKSDLSNNGMLQYPPGKTPEFGIQSLGQFIYDGPSALYNVHWMNFTTLTNVQGKTCHFLLNGGGASSSKNLYARQTFSNPSTPIFCNKPNFYPKLWDWDGTLAGTPRGFIMNPIDINGVQGIDPLIDDGSCKYLPQSNGARIISCGPGTKSAYVFFGALESGLNGNFIVWPDQQPSKQRIIGSRGAPFSDYFLYMRPGTVYRFRYTGHYSCFRFDVRDGQQQDVYRFIFQRDIQKPFTYSPDIAVASSLAQLNNPGQSMQFYKSATKELHVAVKVFRIMPLVDPNGVDLRVGGLDFTKKICF